MIGDHAPTDGELLSEVRAAIAELTDVDPATIGPSSHFQNDLDIDSLALLDLISVVEERIGLELDESQLRSVVTVGDAVDLLKQLASGR